MKVSPTPIVLAIGCLWCAVTILGLLGLWFQALLLSVVLMTLHVVLGSAHEGRIDLGLLIHPILTWATVWMVSFVLAEYFARSFSGEAPDFTILGLHPSFACIVFGYWLGGIATLTVGFSARRSLWMSDGQWSEFTTRMAELNERRDSLDG